MNFAHNILVCSLLLLPLSLYGHTTDSFIQEGKDVYWKDRIAFKTNVLDWVLTTPNIAVDYDIVNTPYDKKSIGIGFKYNWNTSHTYIPKQVYNLLDVRLDYRFHWRPQDYDARTETGDWEREWLHNTKGIDKLKARIDCFRGAENPKSHLSIFMGPYLSLTNYSIKLSSNASSLGRQGVAIGLGLTGGVALPLYGYSNGTALDLELGGSIGCHYTKYYLYKADTESNCYPICGHESKWIYYPLITDMRISLVYRFRSISKQHTEVNYQLLDRRFIAYQMMQKNDEVVAYNKSIEASKMALDRKNAEISLYKSEVESLPNFNSTYSLEYLQPYNYMITPSKKHVRRDTDTLPKIKIDSIAQIEDYLLQDAFASIDSLPGFSRSDLAYTLVQSYNNLVDAPDKSMLNRTEIIKHFYDRVNDDIKAKNEELGIGVVQKIVDEGDVLYKHNVAAQNRQQVTVLYSDSVWHIEMTSNEKAEWRNRIKKQIWDDVSQRRQGNYINTVPKYVLPTDSVTIQTDSIAADSIGVQTNILILDSISNVQSDSIMVIKELSDTLLNEPADNITISYDTTVLLNKQSTKLERLLVFQEPRMWNEGKYQIAIVPKGQMWRKEDEKKYT